MTMYVTDLSLQCYLSLSEKFVNDVFLNFLKAFFFKAWRADVTTVIHFAIYSPKLRNSRYRLKIQNKLLAKYPFDSLLNNTLYTIYQQKAKRDILFTSMLHISLNIKPGPFHFLRKQHELKIQMTSHCYKTVIVRHLKHCFNVIKNQLLSLAKTPQIQKGNSEVTLLQPCFDVNLKGSTVVTPKS